jgi:hypothetical protein
MGVGEWQIGLQIRQGLGGFKSITPGMHDDDLARKIASLLKKIERQGDDLRLTTQSGDENT